MEVGVEINDPEQRLKYHYWPTKLTSVVDGFETAHYTPTGCGIGGSTRLYAGTLERLEPVDFSKQYLDHKMLLSVMPSIMHQLLMGLD